MLSGGGARGAAHVGVLKVLDEMRVPIDAIAGTSMGAVVGGLYASGMSAHGDRKAHPLGELAGRVPDRPPREELGFRRKQDDRNFLVRYALGLTRQAASCCRAAWCRGRSSSRCCATRRCRSPRCSDFDRLPIPFRAIATDLETGEAVVMDSGDLVTAMRASMSAPGVFAPAQRDGRLLVDGGLVENLPIDTARAMGVDVLIVVDVSFPLYARDELTSPLEVTNQAFAILIRGRTLEQRAKLHADRHRASIRRSAASPPPISAACRRRCARAKRRRAMRSASLAQLSLSEDGLSQATSPAAIRARPQLPVIEFVRADPRSAEYDALIEATMQRSGRQAARQGAGAARSCPRCMRSIASSRSTTR